MCSLEMVACCAAKSCGCGDDRADMWVGACEQERDPQVGMEWIKKAAAQGVPEAQFKVGQHLLELAQGGHSAELEGMVDATKSAMPAPKHEDALSWIRRAACSGHGEAAWLLSTRLAAVASGLKRQNTSNRKGSKDGVYEVHREACAWMRRAAELGVVAAQAELGRALRDGRPGLVLCPQTLPTSDAPLPGATATGACLSSNASLVESISWSRRAAQRGDVTAMLDLAHSLGGGWGEAREWLERAAEIGSNSAKYQLGLMYVHDPRGNDESKAAKGLPNPELVARGLDLLRQSGQDGFVLATHHLGMCFVRAWHATLICTKSICTKESTKGLGGIHPVPVSRNPNSVRAWHVENLNVNLRASTRMQLFQRV